MSYVLALRLCVLALAVSVICFGLHLGVTQFHLALGIPQVGVTFLGVFGLTWPLWAYAVATYRRALTLKAK